MSAWDTLEADNDTLIDFLSDPSSYPEHPQSVAQRETHISHVFLTERYAYKLKKRVRFDFLDYSTVELRHRACSDELTLNRRFSPDVYLSIIPIYATRADKPPRNDSTNTPVHFSFQPGGPIVDWLVKMKRLSDDETLDARLRTGPLSDAELQTLSRHLVNLLTRQAPVVIRADRYRSQWENHIQSNQNQLCQLLPFDRNRVEWIHSAQKRFLRLQGDEFAKRVVDGRIIDGHGDLKPEHVYLGPPIHLVDCIEFSAEYRQADIVDELAFLALECDCRGAPAIGQRLLDDYLAVSGDLDNLRFVPFYKSYRASVRAKVAALQTDQAATHRTPMASCVITAQEYLEHAESNARQLGDSLLLIISGLSGTGKSTLAEILVEPLAAKLLQTDVIRRELLEDDPDADAPSHPAKFGEGRYTPDAIEQVYLELVDRARTVLKQSATVILDGTFAKQKHRDLAMRAAAFVKARVVYLYCDCPSETAQTRIRARLQKGNGHSEAQPEYHDRQRAESDPPPPDAIWIDTRSPILSQRDQVLARVRSLLSAHAPTLRQ